MFKVRDVVKVKDDNDNNIWRIIESSQISNSEHFIIKRIDSKISRGVWSDNLINCNNYYRKIKIKKICSRLEKK